MAYLDQLGESSAKTELQRFKRGLATLQPPSAESWPELFPEVPMAVQGFKEEIDAEEWIVVRVVHRVDDQGFTTMLDLELDLKVEGK